jgi:hypothetical protein
MHGNTQLKLLCCVTLFAINNKLVTFLVSFLEISISYRYYWTGCLVVDKNKCKCCLEDSRIVSAEMLPAIRFVRPLICLVHQSISLSYAVLVHRSVALICLSLIRLVHQSFVVFLIFIHWPVSFTSLYVTLIASVQLLYSLSPFTLCSHVNRVSLNYVRIPFGLFCTYLYCK